MLQFYLNYFPFTTFSLFSFQLEAGTITINVVNTINATCSNNASISVTATEALPVTSLFYSLTGSTNNKLTHQEILQTWKPERII